MKGGAAGSPGTGERGLLAAAAGLSLLTLFGTLSLSGIWDPPELKVAELARRIAYNLLGAEDLALEGVNNEVPIRSELGRGELPFTSIALGFRVFGLYDWAGRLPLAIWGLAGAAAVFALVARLADRRAAAFSLIVLVTTPLYFLHARTMLGDIVTMASLSIAVAGFGLALFDGRGADEPARRAVLRRAALAFVGAIGLVAGFFSRGPLIGVAAPALALGLAWSSLRVAGVRSAERFADVTGLALLAAGTLAAVLGVRELVMAEPDEYSLLLGTALTGKRTLPLFDTVVLHLGHALFPWSALVPFALGRMLRAPIAVSEAAAERETALRTSMLFVAALAFGVHAATAPHFGSLPFSAVGVLAVIVGVTLRDFERGAPASRALAMSVAAFTILLLADFRNFPDKALSAFAVSDARFPDSFKHFSERALSLGALAFAGLFALAIMERDTENAPRFQRAEYGRWYTELRGLWAGNLMFTVLVAEAAAVGFLVLGFLSDRWLHLRQFETMGSPARAGAAALAVVLPLAVVAPTVVMALRDLIRALTAPGLGLGPLVSRWPALGRVRFSRAGLGLLAGAGFGAALSFAYYPLLAAQISPKRVFSAYRELAAKDEPLGMIGTSSGSASYYAGRSVPAFDSAAAGFEWLMEPGPRRWLVIRESDLASLNSLYRGRRSSNLPVLDARSSEILLVSSELGASEESQNPFRDWLLDAPPSPHNRVDANFGGQLEVLGWEVKTPQGTVVDAVEPGRPYRFVIYYKVAAHISGNWQTFIHIDGFQRRYNADHPTLEGRYPFNLWRPGDFIADGTDFELEPNFTPGAYRVYFGLFTGSRRLEVKRGRHEENRLEAGTLRVR